MENKDKELYFEAFNNDLHRLGRFTLITATMLLVAVPFVFGMLNGVMPDVGDFLNGFAKVGIVYIPMAIVEFLIYVPLLGVGGSYLSFLTGNVTNMKIPVAMNARDIAGTEVGTTEHEIVSTIAISVSSIVTILVILVGVICLVPLQPVLQSEMLRPAFDNVVPALFGALGLKYFIKSPKIAIVPFVLMSVLCILVPSMINQTSVLMIPSGALALVIGYLLFKYKKL